MNHHNRTSTCLFPIRVAVGFSILQAAVAYSQCAPNEEMCQSNDAEWSDDYLGLLQKAAQIRSNKPKSVQMPSTATDRTYTPSVPSVRMFPPIPPPPPLPTLSPFARWGAVALYAIAWTLMMFLWLPLGRPGTAMVFAIFMCIFRVVCTQHALTSADLAIPPQVYVPTLGLLFGLMIVCEYLKDTGFWHFVESTLDCQSPKRFLILLCVCSGLFSAVLLNDTICFVLPPIVLRICAKRGAPTALPYLVAVSTSANIGSSLTIVGNPQNSLIASMCPDMTFLGFSESMLLPVTLGLLINVACLLSYFREDLVFVSNFGKKCSTPTVIYSPRMIHSPTTGAMEEEAGPSVNAHKGVGTMVYIIITLLIVSMMLIGWFMEILAAYVVLIACAFLIFARAVWRLSVDEQMFTTESEFALTSVDFSLLVLFCGQFIMVGLIMSTGLPPLAFEWALGSSVAGIPTNIVSLVWFTCFVVFICNTLSNVPAIIMLQPLVAALPFVSLDPSLTMAQRSSLPTTVPIWTLVAWIATASGNLTMLGSAANQIVAQVAEKHGDRSYTATRLTKFSFVPTVITIMLGAFIIVSLAVGTMWPLVIAALIGIGSVATIALVQVPEVI